MMETSKDLLIQSENKTSQQKDISLSKVSELYSEYYDELSKFEDGDVIIRPNCKFCLHPARVEAEKKYEDTKSYKAVALFFEEYKKSHPDVEIFDTMSATHISHHITQHYLQQQKRLWIKEYSERVLSVMNKKINDEHRLDMLSRQMEIKLTEIAADPTLDPIKQADSMVKLGKMISDLMLTQAKLKGDIEDVDLMSEKIISIWSKTIQIQSDHNVKRILIEALHSFESQWHGVNADTITEANLLQE